MNHPTILILVQTLDWIATVANVLGGTVTLSQVGAASFLPVPFVAGLLVGDPRGAR